MSIDDYSEMIDVQQEEEHETSPCAPISEYCALSIPSTEEILMEKEPEKTSNVKTKVEIPISIPSSAVSSPLFGTCSVEKFNWNLIFFKCKNWLKHPMNIGLLIWLLCVGASLIMLMLLLLGALNNVFPTKSLRNRWIEINNQVLNGLFTLMSLFEHPDLFHHFFLLCRWRSEDAQELRKVYCKNGMHRPHERSHITVVVVSFHVTCFSQYALCGLYWGYNSKNRPEFWENFFFILGLLAPVFAGLYMVFSPLGREFEYSSIDDTNQSDKSSLKEVSVDLNWNGGLFDCLEDPSIWSLSFFCTCCMFGWNMQRLGFGNMYVHMFTFLLLCIAPFWVLNISALNITNIVLADVIGYAGIFFCFYGLLYGGYWRIQLRKKLKLSGNKFCCRSSWLTDYAQWLFCWSCALAQEIRTCNLYVEYKSLYEKLADVEIGESSLRSTAFEESIQAMIAPVQPVIVSEALVDIAETNSSYAENGISLQSSS